MLVLFSVLYFDFDLTTDVVIAGVNGQLDLLPIFAFDFEVLLVGLLVEDDVDSNIAFKSTDERCYCVLYMFRCTIPRL